LAWKQKAVVNMSDTPQKWWYVFDEPTRILVVDDDRCCRKTLEIFNEQ